MKDTQAKKVIGKMNFGVEENLDGHDGTVQEAKKPFKCDICNTNFGQKSNLNRHVATVHEGKKTLEMWHL